jgi:hypothetical protein
LSLQPAEFESYAGSRPGRGKRGGTRVIYYFHSEDIPLFALDIYAKNEKADLNANEKKACKAVVQNIEKNYREGK